MSNLITHTPKLWERKSVDHSLWMFYCTGCKCCHGFPVGADKVWKFNGNVNSPSFTPSLVCHVTPHCHLVLTDGQIAFQADCGHELRGQTVPMEEI